MFHQIGTNCGVQIQAAFRTDEIRRSPPTPQDEMRAGMSYFHETIWNGLPKFLRRIDTALRSIGITERLPYNIPLVQFSSWMGGDRDGQFFFATQIDGLSCILAFDSRNSKPSRIWIFQFINSLSFSPVKFFSQLFPFVLTRLFHIVVY
jgi:phosphoenolpyruvate carboxylase